MDTDGELDGGKWSVAYAPLGMTRYKSSQVKGSQYSHYIFLVCDQASSMFFLTAGGSLPVFFHSAFDTEPT